MNVVLSLSLCDVGETFVVVFVKLFYYKEMGIAGAGGAHSLMAYCYIIIYAMIMVLYQHHIILSY